MTETTAFVGLSHLGIVSSVGWASLGGDVVAVDGDAERIATLARGETPLHEPGLAELLRSALPRMTFTTDLTRIGECSLVVISRDVPTDASDASDVGVVLDLALATAKHLASGATLAIMSQIPPGFVRALGARIRTLRPGLAFTLVYWVETLIFGRALERFLEPERIILGLDDPATPVPRVLADGLRRFGAPIFPMRYESAELTKTAINIYLCAAVTYANTLADLCEATGADWTEMVPALKADARIGAAAYIRPSLRIAGGNLERDMVTLQKLGVERSVDVVFLETLLAYNERRHAWIHRKLDALVFPTTPRPTLAVWGLAYKRDTDSTKNSVALDVIAALRDRADIRAYDPRVSLDARAGLAILPTRDATLAGADALLILNDSDEFARPDLAALATMRRPLVIDGVGITAGSRLGAVEHVVMGTGAACGR